MTAVRPCPYSSARQAVTDYRSSEPIGSMVVRSERGHGAAARVAAARRLAAFALIAFGAAFVVLVAGLVSPPWQYVLRTHFFTPFLFPASLGCVVTGIAVLVRRRQVMRAVTTLRLEAADGHAKLVSTDDEAGIAAPLRSVVVHTVRVYADLDHADRDNAWPVFRVLLDGPGEKVLAETFESRDRADRLANELGARLGIPVEGARQPRT